MTRQLRDVIKLKSGKILRLSAIDASRLLIDTSSVAYVTANRNENYDITSIDFEGQQPVSIGDEITIRIGLVHTVYKVNSIIVNKEQTDVILFSSLPNKTTIFLLPLLNKTKLQLKYDSYFSNAYVSNCKQYLCLMYRYTGTNLYKTFEESMLQDKLCVGHLDYDKYHVMYIFKIPEMFAEDVEHFFNGRYSKFSNELKKRILKLYGGEMKESSVFQIINKSPKLKEKIEKELGVSLDKDAELASIPNPENEIYNLKEPYGSTTERK